MNEFTVTTHRRDQLSHRGREQSQALLTTVFGEDQDTVWAEGDWLVLVHTAEGILASMVEILERTVTVDRRPVRTGGISSVGTLSEYRRRGYSTAALQVAAEFMRDTLGVSFALLVTGDEEIPFYQRLGWQVFAGPVSFDQPDGRILTHDGVNMVLPLSSDTWPSGPVHLCGLPW
jgi:predicted acetyltransferase